MKHYCHGLTGGIGSGKSTVAQFFAELGVRVIDTDLISHQLTQANGAAIPEIQKAFGSAFVNAEGALERRKMRELVFADNDAKRRLEAILHPLILSTAQTLAASATNAPYTLVVVPLLLESARYRDWLQRIIVVDCPETLQLTRTMRRGNLSEPDVLAIMQQQITRARRLEAADEIIHNDGQLDTLRAQVQALHSRLIGL